MADVVVTVSIDGKQAYVHGAGNAPDAHAFVAGALQAASDHFKSVVASRTPQMQTGGILGAPRPGQPNTQDNSL